MCLALHPSSGNNQVAVPAVSFFWLETVQLQAFRSDAGRSHRGTMPRRRL